MSDLHAQAMVPLAIAVPMALACGLLALGSRVPRLLRDIVAVLGATAVVGVTAMLLVGTSGGRTVVWAGGWSPVHGRSVGIVLAADSLGCGLALLVAALVWCAVVYSWHHVEDASTHYHALVLFFLAGMEAFSLTGDLFDMFVFFELMGAVAYALTGFKIEDKTAVQGAVSFGVVNSLGAYFSLMGVGLLYGRYGELGLPQLGRKLAGQHPDALVVAAFVLVVTSFLVKAAAVPFHFWLADAHAVAPTPICLLFSGVMVELGVYAVFRVTHVVFLGTLPAADVRRTMLVLGVITAAVGSLLCWYQRHLKRLLAYSTIAHVGLFLVGLSALDGDGTAGAALYVLGHAGVKAALFLIVGGLLNRYGSVDEHELAGRGRNARVMPWLYLLAALGLAGLPPFGTGLGKGVSEDALSALGYDWVPALFVIVSGVTGAAVLRAGFRVWFGWGCPPDHADQHPEQDGETVGEEEPDVDHPLRRIPITMFVPTVLLVLGGLAVGLVPGLAGAVSRAAERFVDAKGYIGQALDGAAPSPVHAGAHVAWTASGVALDLVSVVVALAIALLAVQSHRVPALVRRAGGAVMRPLDPPLAAVRRSHSGHIGDYVAWLVAGVAALGALIGLPLR